MIRTAMRSKASRSTVVHLDKGLMGNSSSSGKGEVAAAAVVAEDSNSRGEVVGFNSQEGLAFLDHASLLVVFLEAFRHRDGALGLCVRFHSMRDERRRSGGLNLGS